MAILYGNKCEMLYALTMEKKNKQMTMPVNFLFNVKLAVLKNLHTDDDNGTNNNADTAVSSITCLFFFEKKKGQLNFDV